MWCVNTQPKSSDITPVVMNMPRRNQNLYFGTGSG